MSRIGGAIRDTMSIENDAPRVNVWERGRPVSDVVKCPGSDPRAFLFALVAAQMPSTVRTARAPTDLKPNLIRVKKRDDERSHRTMEAGRVIPKKRGRLQCGVCPEKRMAKQERGWTRKVSASLMAITSHLPKGWVSERYSCSDSSACLRLRMRCATPMHSTAPPAIQVKVTPLRPVSGRPEPFWSTMVKLSLPTSAFAESA